MGFEQIDLVILIGYLMLMMGFGIWIANREKNESAKDYFLASGALPWWAVGGSLIASNISTEQILGMNGSGYVMGLAIGAYELMAALTLILVAKFLLPVFIKKGIYTMPQFLEERFDRRVRTIMAFFWVTLFVLVNVTSVLYLGALAIQNIFGFDWAVNDIPEAIRALSAAGIENVSESNIVEMLTANEGALGENLAVLLENDFIQRNYNVPLYLGITGLVLYSATLSIFGGLKAVVWTDVIQVIILIIGGFTASYMVLSFVGDGSAMAGISHLFGQAPEHFDMVLDKGQILYESTNDKGEVIMKDAWNDLPSISVLVGGVWIANIYYWGNNQYIIQRALASKSLPEAQRGVAFAAFMKLVIPFFAVLPGIAAYVILQNPEAYGFTGAGIAKPDESFPWVLTNFVQTGFKGLVLAALIAAIGSSISSIVNSVSTIFTLDIYKNLFAQNNSDEHYVKVGRISATAALILGALIAPSLGSLEQVFQYIQKYTGFISPGVVAVFLFGMFWKRTTSNAALVGILISIPFSWAMQTLLDGVPFLERMTLTFAVVSAIMVIISVLENKQRESGRKSDMPFIIGLCLTIVVISVPAGFRILFGDIDASAYLGVSILGISGLIFALLIGENKADDAKAIHIDTSLFKTDNVFNISAIAVCIVLAIIYTSLW